MHTFETFPYKGALQRCRGVLHCALLLCKDHKTSHIKSSRTAQGLAEFLEQITVVLARDSVSSASFSAEKRVGRFDRPAGNGV